MEIKSILLSYKNMREKAKMTADNLSACDTLAQIAASMTEYIGKDAGSIKTNFLEMYLLCCGSAAIIDAKDMPAAIGTGKDEGLLVCMAERCGTPDANGMGRDLILSTLDGRVKTIHNFESDGKDIVVYVKNNLFATPDITIGQTGDLIMEYYESLRHNIVNSRLTPVIACPNEQSKKSVEGAQKENRAGSYMVVVSDNILDDTGEIKILNPTNVKDQDKIQYLNHAYDDILRHWYNLHGMDINGTSKLAQMSVDEVSRGTNSRKCLPLVMMSERKKAMERVREVFGIDIDVDFSDAWRLEFGLAETPVDTADRTEGAGTVDTVDTADTVDGDAADTAEEKGEEGKTDGEENN